MREDGVIHYLLSQQQKHLTEPELVKRKDTTLNPADSSKAHHCVGEDA